MNEDLSLFSAVNDEEMELEQLQQTVSEQLIANRNSAMQKYAQETAAMMPETEELIP